jgi:hypothetical protein
VAERVDEDGWPSLSRTALDDLDPAVLGLAPDDLVSGRGGNSRRASARVIST